MQRTLSYRHRVITDDDLVFIRKLIAEHPGSSRWALSKKLCQAWNWVQANGALRDMVCRGMMLMLHRQGLIELPPTRPIPIQFGRRRRPLLVSVDEAALHTPAGWSPYHGREVKSSVETVLVRGRRVFARGEVIGVPGGGRWVRPRLSPSPVAA